jgi:hypothetical protein
MWTIYFEIRNLLEPLEEVSSEDMFLLSYFLNPNSIEISHSSTQTNEPDDIRGSSIPSSGSMITAEHVIVLSHFGNCPTSHFSRSHATKQLFSNIKPSSAGRSKRTFMPREGVKVTAHRLHIERQMPSTLGTINED